MADNSSDAESVLMISGEGFAVLLRQAKGHKGRRPRMYYGEDNEYPGVSKTELSTPRVCQQGISP
jgi:hypothetical protein